MSVRKPTAEVVRLRLQTIPTLDELKRSRRFDQRKARVFFRALVTDRILAQRKQANVV